MRKDTINTNINRVVYLDYLRVLAIFAVIMIHVSCAPLFSETIGSASFLTSLVFDGICRWGVPVFIMISGALFIGRDISYGVLLKRNVAHIIKVYFLWALFYSIITQIEGYRGLGNPIAIRNILLGAISGEYHMWFLPMICGLYILLPIYNSFVKDPFVERLFLIFSVVFSVVLPQCISVCFDFGSKNIVLWATAVNNLISYMHIGNLLGYGGYFYLGYYIDKRMKLKKPKMLSVVLLLGGILYTLFCAYCYSIKYLIFEERYFGYFDLGVMMEAVGIMILFKSIPTKYFVGQVLFRKLSDCVLGAYLVHAFVLNIINNYIGIKPTSGNTCFSILFIWLMTVLVSFVVSYLINNVRIFRKIIL